MMKKLVVLILCIAAFASCKQQSKNDKKVFKGYVIWEKDYTTFTNCETGKTYWIEDKTNEVEKQYAALTQKPYQEIYFEFEADLLPPSTVGVKSSFDNIISVKTVVKSQLRAPENACKNKEEKTAFSCFGEDPNWTFGFGKDVKFTAKHPKDTVVYFPMAEPEIRDSAGVGRIFYYNINNENFQNIQVIISEKPCKVGKKYYRFTAKALLGEFEYNGCANLTTITNEEYSNFEPSADVPLSGM